MFACGPGSDLAEVGVGDQVQIEIKLLKKKGKPKRIGRTPFGLSR